MIWLIADQWRAQATGYAGDPNIATPHLDRLAAEGFDFSRAVAGSPLCSPSRGSMFTGKFPHNSGVAGHEHPLPDGMPTIATELGAAGYRTCFVGKWHLDGNRPELGPHTFGDAGARARMIPAGRRAGFDDWWAYENGNRPFDTLVHTDADQVPLGADVVAKESGMVQFRLPGYETDGLTDLLLEWIGDHVHQRPEQPFFSVLSVQPPHNPYVAPAETMGRHSPGRVQLRPNVPPIARVQDRARRDLAGYYAAIERLDDNVGRLRQALAEHDLADDTYLVVTSDHGDMLGSHGLWHKTSPWEESIRVPLLIGGPSREHQDRAGSDRPIGLVDLMPTTLGLCGLTADGLDGADFSGLVTGRDRPGHPGGPPGRAADRPPGTYIGIPTPTGHRNSVGLPWRGVVTDDGWKYVTLDGRPWLMFDLDDDPYELVDLAHIPQHRRRRDELADLLHAWDRHTGFGSDRGAGTGGGGGSGPD